MSLVVFHQRFPDAELHLAFHQPAHDAHVIGPARAMLQPTAAIALNASSGGAPLAHR